MQDLNFYIGKQDENSQLIHLTGLLWGQLSSHLDKVLSKVNLNIAKFNILMIIKHVGQEKGLLQNEISSRLLVTASNITKLLDKLEIDSLITRNAKENDRRAKIIKITKKGSDLLDGIWQEYQDAIRKISPEISLVKKKELIKNMQNWADCISNCHGPT